jgi:1-deoxy-D-xylulose-5-phosphate reductoisomerase
VVKAELGQPDMRKPIQHALTAPERIAGLSGPFDPIGVDLTFSAPDRVRFPALDMGYAAGRRGGNAPAVLNAADEIAVAAFLARRIGFHEITEVVADALGAVPEAPIPTLALALAADAAGRVAAEESIASRSAR